MLTAKVSSSRTAWLCVACTWRETMQTPPKKPKNSTTPTIRQTPWARVCEPCCLRQRLQQSSKCLFFLSLRRVWFFITHSPPPVPSACSRASVYFMAREGIATQFDLGKAAPIFDRPVVTGHAWKWLEKKEKHILSANGSKSCWQSDALVQVI